MRFLLRVIGIFIVLYAALSMVRRLLAAFAPAGHVTGATAGSAGHLVRFRRRQRAFVHEPGGAQRAQRRGDQPGDEEVRGQRGVHGHPGGRCAVQDIAIVACHRFWRRLRPSSCRDARARSRLIGQDETESAPARFILPGNEVMCV